MKEYLIKESTLTGIADAIRNKTNQKDTLTPNNYSFEVNKLSLNEDNDVCFFDYDGTLIYAYSFEEIDNLTELPPGPQHDGLIFQGWNWTLEGLKKVNNMPTDVGANYITDDGKTRIYLNVNLVSDITVPLRYWQSVANGVEIDWGDGSPVETSANVGAVILNHTYAIGKYVLTLNPIGDCELRLNGQSTSTEDSFSMMGEITYDIYNTLFYKIELGKNIYELSQYVANYSVNLETITVPIDCKTFKIRALFNARSLRYLVFPINSTPSAGGGMFSGCNTLYSVSFPESAAQNFGNVFGYCYWLSRVRLPYNASAAGHYNQGYVIEEYLLPSNITTIQSQTFDCNYILKEIKYQNNEIAPIVSIGTAAFSNCRLLRKFDFPDTLKTIGNQAFRWCYSLREIILPSSLTSIGTNAFESCYGLCKINIPAGITTIPENLLINCKGLQEIDFTTHNTVPTMANINSLSGIPSTCKILVPNTLVSEWKSTTNWSTYADQIIGV